MAAILVISGASALASCSKDDETTVVTAMDWKTSVR